MARIAYRWGVKNCDFCDFFSFFFFFMNYERIIFFEILRFLTPQLTGSTKHHILTD